MKIHAITVYPLQNRLLVCVVYVFLDAATLTEIFPCFFLSCKANARVNLAKTGHGPHSPKLLCCYVEIKCQLDAAEVFIADLIAFSTRFGHHYAHHQELKSIIEWLLPVVFRAVVFKLLVWCGAEGYVSGLQDAAASYQPDT